MKIEANMVIAVALGVMIATVLNKLVVDELLGNSEHYELGE